MWPQLWPRGRACRRGMKGDQLKAKGRLIFGIVTCRKGPSRVLSHNSTSTNLVLVAAINGNKITRPQLARPRLRCFSMSQSRKTPMFYQPKQNRCVCPTSSTLETASPLGSICQPRSRRVLAACGIGQPAEGNRCEPRRFFKCRQTAPKARHCKNHLG